MNIENVYDLTSYLNESIFNGALSLELKDISEQRDNLPSKEGNESVVQLLDKEEEKPLETISIIQLPEKEEKIGIFDIDLNNRSELFKKNYKINTDEERRKKIEQKITDTKSKFYSNILNILYPKETKWKDVKYEKYSDTIMGDKQLNVNFKKFLKDFGKKTSRIIMSINVLLEKDTEGRFRNLRRFVFEAISTSFEKMYNSCKTLIPSLVNKKESKILGFFTSNEKGSISYSLRDKLHDIFIKTKLSDDMVKIFHINSMFYFDLNKYISTPQIRPTEENKIEEEEEENIEGEDSYSENDDDNSESDDERIIREDEEQSSNDDYEGIFRIDFDQRTTTFKKNYASKKLTEEDELEFIEAKNKRSETCYDDILNAIYPENEKNRPSTNSTSKENGKYTNVTTKKDFEKFLKLFAYTDPLEPKKKPIHHIPYFIELLINFSDIVNDIFKITKLIVKTKDEKYTYINAISFSLLSADFTSLAKLYQNFAQLKGTYKAVYQRIYDNPLNGKPASLLKILNKRFESIIKSCTNSDILKDLIDILLPKEPYFYLDVDKWEEEKDEEEDEDYEEEEDNDDYEEEEYKKEEINEKEEEINDDDFRVEKIPEESTIEKNEENINVLIPKKKKEPKNE